MSEKKKKWHADFKRRDPDGYAEYCAKMRRDPAAFSNMPLDKPRFGGIVRKVASDK